jgi:phosphohistidine phosphatase
MKTLYIIRHAKSSWDDPNLDDFDRPLNKRGEKNAPVMGKRLKERGLYPTQVLSSPARRTAHTAAIISKSIGFDARHITLEPRLYHADKSEILHVLKQLDIDHHTVLLFGHNPGLTEFINALRNDGKVLPNLPTCGVVAFRCAIQDWKELTWNCGKVILYDYPKNKI